MTGVKNITSETNALSIQFHSDENDNKTQNFQYFTRTLKGFWLYLKGNNPGKYALLQKSVKFASLLKGSFRKICVLFTAKPTASVRVACRPLNQNDAEVQEIKRDDDEYDQIMTTKHIDTTPDPSDKTKVVQIRKHSHLLMDAILFGKKDVEKHHSLKFSPNKNLAFIIFIREYIL